MNKTSLASAIVLLVLSGAPAFGQSDARAEQERAAAALAVEAEALEERAEELERAQAELQRAAEEVARLAQQKGLRGNRMVTRMHRLEKSAKPRLGVWLSSEDGEPTVISRVAPESAAAEGGIEEGDVIVSVDGAAVLDLKFPQVATLISDALAPKAVGDSVIIEVERDGERLQRELTLNKHSFAPLANRFSFSTGDKDDVFVFDMDGEGQNAIFAENAEKLFELRG
ncbi:MAG: PDZ domain-containing protein, partial [Pseudomonadota bacterium]